MNEEPTSTVEARIKRWRDFYEPGASGHLFMIGYQDLPERPLPHPDRIQERIEWAWQHYQFQLERLEWLEDDSIPYLCPYTGTEIFAEAFGCQVHRPDNTMPFALPLITRAAEVAKVKVPELSSSSLAVYFEMVDELRRRAGNGAVPRMVDMQSPMDIAALIWDKNAFYMAILEAPEAVKELAGKVNELLKAFLDEWYARYGTAFIAHYPDYYMPAGITLSVDEVGIVNEEMFQEFFLPELVELSERYGGIGIHCCADARHQWDNFSRVPNLRLLNLVQPVEVMKEAYSWWAERTTQMHCWCGEGEPWTWAAQYPANARVVLQAPAESPGQARELSARLRHALGRG